jgi:hypothetical protein
MRRAVPGLLLSVLLTGCSGDWTPEQKLTKQSLVNAHMVRGAVSYQVNRYSEVLRAAATAPDPAKQSGENLAAYFASEEGKVVSTLLNGVLKPAPADPSMARAKDLDEVNGATAALAGLALQPRGAWDDWTRKIEGAQSRLYRATEALEKGTKSYVLIDVRQEANIKTAEFTATLGKARAASEAAAKTR